MGNIFEKMGLVEKVAPEPPAEEYPMDYFDESEDTIEVSTDSINAETLIADAYRSNDLADTNKSIFKVEEIRASLPATIPIDTKRETVKGILTSFGISVEDVDADAKARHRVIRVTCETMCDEETSKIKQLQAEVEDLYQQAEAKKKEITERNQTVDSIEAISKAEIEHISELWSFITGTEHNEKEE